MSSSSRRSSTLAEASATTITFAEVIFFIVISAIIAILWLRAFENYVYGTIGLSEKSWYVAVVLATAMTILIILVVINFPLTVETLGIRSFVAVV